MEEKKGMILYYVQEEKKEDTDRSHWHEHVDRNETVKAVRSQYAGWKTSWFKERRTAGFDTD